MAGGESATTLTVDDATAIADGVGQIAAIAPEVDGRYQIIASSANTNTQVIGTVSSYTEVHKITLSEGSFISDVQNQNASRVVVLGSTAATDLFGDPTSGGTDPLGQTLRIKGLQFTVIGVTTSKGGTDFNSPDDAIYVPLTTSQRFLAGQTKYLSSIGVEAATQGAMTQVQTDITDLLLTRHKITDSASADFSVINQTDLASTLSSTTRTLTLASRRGRRDIADRGRHRDHEHDVDDSHRAHPGDRSAEGHRGQEARREYPVPG